MSTKRKTQRFISLILLLALGLCTFAQREPQVKFEKNDSWYSLKLIAHKNSAEAEAVFKFLQEVCKSFDSFAKEQAKETSRIYIRFSELPLADTDSTQAATLYLNQRELSKISLSQLSSKFIKLLLQRRFPKLKQIPKWLIAALVHRHLERHNDHFDLPQTYIFSRHCYENKLPWSAKEIIESDIPPSMPLLYRLKREGCSLILQHLSNKSHTDLKKALKSGEPQLLNDILERECKVSLPRHSANEHFRSLVLRYAYAPPAPLPPLLIQKQLELIKTPAILDSSSGGFRSLPLSDLHLSEGISRNFILSINNRIMQLTVISDTRTRDILKQYQLAFRSLLDDKSEYPKLLQKAKNAMLENIKLADLRRTWFLEIERRETPSLQQLPNLLRLHLTKQLELAREKKEKIDWFKSYQQKWIEAQLSP